MPTPTSANLKRLIRQAMPLFQQQQRAVHQRGRAQRLCPLPKRRQPHRGARQQEPILEQQPLAQPLSPDRPRQYRGVQLTALNVGDQLVSLGLAHLHIKRDIAAAQRL